MIGQPYFDSSVKGRQPRHGCKALASTHAYEKRLSSPSPRTNGFPSFAASRHRLVIRTFYLHGIAGDHRDASGDRLARFERHRLVVENDLQQSHAHDDDDAAAITTMQSRCAPCVTMCDLAEWPSDGFPPAGRTLLPSILHPTTGRRVCPRGEADEVRTAAGRNRRRATFPPPLPDRRSSNPVICVGTVRDPTVGWCRACKER